MVVAAAAAVAVEGGGTMVAAGGGGGGGSLRLRPSVIFVRRGRPLPPSTHHGRTLRGGQWRSGDVR